MKFTLKKLRFAIFLMILSITVTWLPSACSAESNPPENALPFLTEIYMLDTEQYDVKAVTYNDYTDTGGIVRGEAKYTLESDSGTVEVLCDFRNNIITYCKIYAVGGSFPHAQGTSIGLLDRAKGLLDSYKAYSGAAYIQSMQEMLNSVAEMKPMSITSGDVKLTISNFEQYTYIDWIYTVNGIDVDYKSFRLGFWNGSFEHFGDTWDLYKIGNTDVHVSREEALLIAREQAEKYIVNVWPGEKANLSIVEQPVKAELSMQGRSNYTLYPHWSIQLYFDEGYNEWNGIQVFLWADTAEVTHVGPTGSLGGIPNEEPHIPDSFPNEPSSPENEADKLPASMYIAVAVTTIAIVVAIVAVAKKKRNQ